MTQTLALARVSSALPLRCQSQTIPGWTNPVLQDRAAERLLHPQAWPFLSTLSPAGIKALTSADKSFFRENSKTPEAKGGRAVPRDTAHSSSLQQAERDCW